MHRHHVLVLDRWTREIRMAMPFSTVPTAFRTEIGDRTWWANCAWDALGIVAMLDADATVRTRCPATDEILRVSVRAGRVVDARPVLYFPLPACQWWEEVEFT